MKSTAKSTEQKFLSRVELRKNKQVRQIQNMVSSCDEFIIDACHIKFGGLFVRRLRRSAAHSGRSVVGYCADVLVS